MGMDLGGAALSFCKTVAKDPSISHAEAKFGAWLIGAAALTGGFPIELTTHQIRAGFTRGGVTVAGLGSRHETIKAAIESLEDAGLIEVGEGPQVGFGYAAKVFDIRR